MKFKMDIYFTPDEIIGYVPDITESVMERLEETGKQDLFYALEEIEDKDIAEIVGDFVDTLGVEEILPYLTILEDFEFDKNESEDCDYEYLAYLVTVELDIDGLYSDSLKSKEEA